MTCTVALFTRDLRVHDNPMLVAAVEAGHRVVPLFVLDQTILASGYSSPNRATFLAGSLADLDASLRRLGADGLVVRRGEVAEETAMVAAAGGAEQVHVSADWSGYAQRREERLAQRLTGDGRRLVVHPGTVAVVPPGTLLPSGSDHYAVFTPYHRRWEQQPLRNVLAPPAQVRSHRARTGPLPAPDDICTGQRAEALPEPGEGAARRRLEAWLRSSLGSYGAHQDDLAADDTSRISPYLHLGCLSPTEVVTRAARTEAGRPFVRQLAWRDFNLQILAARPWTVHEDYRSRGDAWRSAGSDLEAWKQGRTGYPIVDAGMRQLLHEGWMHNRARLVTGSFLTKHLGIDWRAGAAHFMEHLVDGDVANNQLNWQWVAGTGADTRPYRVLNPLRQAERFDAHGDYVRRHVAELAGVPGGAVHRPWELPDGLRATLDYPDRVVDLDETRRRFLAGLPG